MSFELNIICPSVLRSFTLRDFIEESAQRMVPRLPTLRSFTLRNFIEEAPMSSRLIRAYRIAKLYASQLH